MELEGEYRRFVTVGPKKYCCVKDDGSYEWACNGMPAKSNTQTDVLRKFEAVLEGQVVDIDYFIWMMCILYHGIKIMLRYHMNIPLDDVM